MLPGAGDTVCAISTPPGVGGIAVARLSGPQALAIAQAVWRGRRAIVDTPANTCIVGTVLDSRGDDLDQAVATVFRAPHSFTGEDVVEFGVHGSRYVQHELIMALVGAGARIALPGEFSRRAFASGHMDLAQTEAVADLIAADSRAAQRVALSQMRGHFSRRIEAMRSQLVDLAALLELELDFSEEDVEFASRERLSQLAGQVRDTATRLADGFAAGRAIREGIPVAIVGATNAGKSSILNTLTDDDRAIVSDIHGTTRDVVEDTISLGDYTLRLRDTAGIRDTADTIERLGIERSRDALRAASIVILVIDSAAPLDAVPWGDVAANPDAAVIVAANKSDVASAQPSFAQLPGAVVVATSARTGAGIPALREAITDAADRITRRDSPSDLIVTNARHHRALRDAAAAAARVVDALAAGLPGDLVAQDLRACIDALSAITGAISTPEILSTIFSRFCIGK